LAPPWTATSPPWWNQQQGLHGLYVAEDILPAEDVATDNLLVFGIHVISIAP